MEDQNQSNSPEEFPDFQNINIAQVSAWIYGGMVFVGLIWLSFQEGGLDRLTRPFEYDVQTFSRHMALALAVALVSIILSRLAVVYFEWARHLEGRFKKLMGELSSSDIFVMAFCSGLGEELFFRGAMQPVLGLTWTSLIFGLLHVMPSQPSQAGEEAPSQEGLWKKFAWTIFAIIMGFVLGYLYIYTDNLLVPVVTHFTINFVNLHFINRTDISQIETGHEE